MKTDKQRLLFLGISLIIIAAVFLIGFFLGQSKLDKIKDSWPFTLPGEEKTAERTDFSKEENETQAKAEKTDGKGQEASGTEENEYADEENLNLPAWWYMPDKDQYFPVAKIVDGDTIVIKIENYHRKMRLIGIDAPESVHSDPLQNTAEGKEAHLFLTDLLEGKSVRIEYDLAYRDRFERDLIYCYLPDGTFVNQAIVRAGQARLMTRPPNIKYVDLLEEALQSAKKDKLGIWQD